MVALLLPELRPYLERLLEKKELILFQGLDVLLAVGNSERLRFTQQICAPGWR
jgi:hypothetical protein